MESVDSKTHRGLIVSLHYDQDCESPREHDNLGTIIAWHRRYDLADKHAPKHIDPQDFDPNEYPICLPVWMYEHSGIALSCGSRTGQFADRWDSGQLGWIYVTRETLLREYSAKRLTKRILERAEAVLRSEIEEYSKYVEGQCYGYTIRAEAGTAELDADEEDSCWGFIGYEYAWQSAIEAADAIADRRDRQAEALIELGKGSE